LKSTELDDIFEGGNKVPLENVYIRKKSIKNARNH